MMYKHKLSKLLAISVLTITCFTTLATPKLAFAKNMNEEGGVGSSRAAVGMDLVVPEKIVFHYDNKTGKIKSSDYVVQNLTDVDIGVLDLKFVPKNGWSQASDPSLLPSMPANSKQMILNANIRGKDYDIISGIQHNTTRETNQEFVDIVFANDKKVYALNGQTCAITQPINEECGTIILTFGKTDTPTEGQTVEMGDYIFTYTRLNSVQFSPDKDAMHIPGWNVKVRDKNKTTYGKIPSHINGYPVVSLYGTFWDCPNIEQPPEGGLPYTIVTMNHAFDGCINLKTPPVLPPNVINMEYAFKDCKTITAAPAIPHYMANMGYAFQDCDNLITPPPEIPKSVYCVNQTFLNCTKLTTLVNGEHVPIKVNMYELLNGNLDNANAFPGTIGPNDQADGLLPKIYIDYNDDRSNFNIIDHMILTGNGNVNTLDRKTVSSQQLGPNETYKAADGTTVNEGDYLPLPKVGDKFTKGDYTYTYQQNDGWRVDVNDKQKTEYQEIEIRIADRPVTDLSNTFSGCTNMKTAPKIHQEIRHASLAFMNCTSLQGDMYIDAKKLDQISLSDSQMFLFAGNPAVTGKIVLHYNETNKDLVTKIHMANQSNTELYDPNAIDENVVQPGQQYIKADGTILNPGDPLPEIPELNDKFIEGDYTYTMKQHGGWHVMVNDKGKTEYSEIKSVICGKQVTDMTATFMDCKELIKAPVIHENITTAVNTFANCYNLTGSAVINASELKYDGIFSGTAFDAGTATYKTKIILEGNNTNSNLLESIHKLNPKNTRLGYTGDVVPAGHKYIVAGTPEIEVQEGQKMPVQPGKGDKYITKEYTYTAIQTNEGITWQVSANNKEQTAYGKFLETIAGVQVKNLDSAYKDCTKMVTAPIIPKTITSMKNTFEGCKNLKEVTFGNGLNNAAAYENIFLNAASANNPVYIKPESTGNWESNQMVQKIHEQHPDNTTLDKNEQTPTEVVPDGCIYIVAKPHKEITQGNPMPQKAKVGDEFHSLDYIYTCYKKENKKLAWKVRVKDLNQNKSVYEPIKENILNHPVDNMDNAFVNCSEMIKSPVIHKNIQSAKNAFNGCSKLNEVKFEIANAIDSTGMFTNAAPNTAPTKLIPNGTNIELVRSIHNMFPSNTIMDGESPDPNPDIPQFDGPVIPEGHKYIVAGQPPIEVPAGSKMPSQMKVGDQYVTADYTYTVYSTDGWEGSWNVKVNDSSKKSYEPILETINNKKVNIADGAFQNCVNLEKGPTVPQSITSMKNMFSGCKNLKEVGFANSLWDASKYAGIFNDAGSETNKVYIHSEPYSEWSSSQDMVAKINKQHPKNTTLKKPKVTKDAPNPETLLLAGEKYIINSNPKVTITEGETLPEIPLVGDQLITKDYTYTCYDDNGTLAWNVSVNNKTQTTYEPLKMRIADQPVNDISNTFANCKNMTQVPNIPTSVQYADRAFLNCYSLTDIVIIKRNENFKSSVNMFKNTGKNAGTDKVVIVHMDVANKSWAMTDTVLNQPFKVRNVTIAWEGATADLPPEGGSEEQSPVQNNDFQYIPTGTTTPVAPDQLLPPPQVGDKCVSKDYEYTLTDAGWKVNLKPDSQGKVAFDALANEINGQPITNIEGLFSGNTTIETAPMIPATVTNAKDAFADCPNLKGPIYIQSETLNYDDMFDDAGENNPDVPIVLIGTGTEANNKLLEEIVEENDDANLVIGIPEKDPLNENHQELLKNEALVPNEPNPEQNTDGQMEIPNEDTHQQETPDVNVPQNDQQNTDQAEPPVLEGQQGLEENNQQPSENVESTPNGGTEEHQQPEQVQPPVNTEENIVPEQAQEENPIVPEVPADPTPQPEVIDYTKKVMIDDILYKETKSTNKNHDGVITGEITSTVNGPDDPTVNNQSNFGIGYQYTKRETTVEVKIEDKWVIFESEEPIVTEEPQEAMPDQIPEENVQPEVPQTVEPEITDTPVENNGEEQLPNVTPSEGNGNENSEPVIPPAVEPPAEPAEPPVVEESTQNETATPADPPVTEETVENPPVEPVQAPETAETETSAIVDTETEPVV